MRLKQVFGFTLCTLFVFTVLPSVSSAQAFQRPLRWLGQGFSDGYHRCNPGPNSDYYNPYSAHNSLLISQSPDAVNYLPAHLRQKGIVQPGIPFSVYASPLPANEGQNFESLPGQPIDNSIEPYDPQQNQNDENENEGELDDLDKPDGNSVSAPQVPGPTEELKASDNQFDFSKTGFQSEPTVSPADNQFDPFGDD